MKSILVKQVSFKNQFTLNVFPHHFLYISAIGPLSRMWAPPESYNEKSAEYILYVLCWTSSNLLLPFIMQ